jgi:hypothetical protein
LFFGNNIKYFSFRPTKTIKAGKFMKITLSKQQKTKKKLENFFSNNKKLSTEKQLCKSVFSTGKKLSKTF